MTTGKRGMKVGERAFLTFTRQDPTCATQAHHPHRFNPLEGPTHMHSLRYYSANARAARRSADWRANAEAAVKVIRDASKEIHEIYEAGSWHYIDCELDDLLCELIQTKRSILGYLNDPDA